MASQLNFKELQELAAEILGIDPDQVQMDKRFQRDLAADSLDLVELIATIEDKYDVELRDSELENMKVIGDLWKFLEQKTAERLGPRADGHHHQLPDAFRCGSASVLQGQGKAQRYRGRRCARPRKGDHQPRSREDDGHVRQVDHRADGHPPPPHRRAGHDNFRARYRSCPFSSQSGWDYGERP